MLKGPFLKCGPYIKNLNFAEHFPKEKVTKMATLLHLRETLRIRQRQGVPSGFKGVQTFVNGQHACVSPVPGQSIRLT